jgi:hypothetical protein
MPGQRNWIVLLVAGAVALLFGIGMTVSGYRVMIGLIPFGLVLLFIGAAQANISRRFVTESMRNAADDLRDSEHTDD